MDDQKPNPTKDDAKDDSKDVQKVKYFRSKIAGLSVVVDQTPAEGQIAPQIVKFTAYNERVFGDQIKVGYLATDNARAIELLSVDPSVEVITKKEYDASTDVENGARLATQ